MTYADEQLRARVTARRGFTLIEVMISVAMVLLLLYGVTQVFKMSTDAMGANQAVSTIVRDHRAAFSAIGDDFRNAAFDSPLFLISSTLGVTRPVSDSVGGVTRLRGEIGLYKNGADEAENPINVGGSPIRLLTRDTTAANREAPQVADRNPRIDRLGFFARGYFRRQIARQLPEGASMESWVWYGHAAGDSTGKAGAYSTYNGAPLILPENQYGDNRVLGRVQILLRGAGSGASGPFAGNVTTANPPTNADPFWPLNFAQGSYQFGRNYGDLAPQTIDDIRARTNLAFKQFPFDWYKSMEDFDQTNGGTAGGPEQYFRYVCETRVERAIDFDKTARLLPYFLPRCSQFVVEYAGDFVSQDADGRVVNTKTDRAEGMIVQQTKPTPGNPDKLPYKEEFVRFTDGKVDFVVDQYGGPNDHEKKVRRVRWYGLPRDVNGDGSINAQDDVVPLRDILARDGFKADTSQGPLNFGNELRVPWEVQVPPLMNDYKDVTAQDVQNSGFKYTCAFNNGAPAMIRVLLKMEDPSGKLQDGQWYEYVFTR